MDLRLPNITRVVEFWSSNVQLGESIGSHGAAIKKVILPAGNAKEFHFEFNAPQRDGCCVRTYYPRGS
jgi:hypothetical protein